MNLPILGTLSTLFTKANEKLQELLQPWALFSAAIFLGLGFILIYLPLQHRVPDLIGEEKLTEAQQLIIASVVVFAVSQSQGDSGGLRMQGRVAP